VPLFRIVSGAISNELAVHFFREIDITLSYRVRHRDSQPDMRYTDKLMHAQAVR